MRNATKIFRLLSRPLIISSEFVARAVIEHLKDDEGALLNIGTRMTQRVNVVRFRTFPHHHQAGQLIQLNFRTFSTLNLGLGHVAAIVRACVPIVTHCPSRSPGSAD